MSQSQQSPASLQPTEGSSDSRHQECCVQAALNMSSLYQQGQTQLHNMHIQLKATHNYIQATAEDTRRRYLAIENELNLEREANELVNQQLAELEEHHCELLKKYKSAEELREDLSKYMNNSDMFANEVARRAESLVNDLQAKLAGGQVAELQNGQSISEMILESAKNALLVRAISGQHSEENPLTPLEYITDQNVVLQQRNMDLSIQVESLSKQVEDGKNEVANLVKALELTAGDGRRKKPRRGKMSQEKK
ncbi:hypothetical protein PtrSN002B_005540 [Pyrenophora tritici-repentis]|uniref:Uncharacterized protein n=2 Tax=Pyrenophora tritici-repentis TaxID=45151 RepID=A0A2W1HFA4_9PLEO|nr:hypothetical protein PtrV1_13848 [Pyrenophora tritici-repentis]KAF7569459.1 hypothetical protein PtrM4_118740 [Pyrenophora tritici-repentis]KAG9382777.1 hypothetical protein A1F94_006698 [Pyrenophora tritici-repentis]KAI0586764.1 hypothetical protein Alg215_01802 [Pyrenophora tritici-repentis]KAI0626751.1 hypothetical protein TUN199_01305 [Pyrenophora tritici-repentis]